MNNKDKRILDLIASQPGARPVGLVAETVADLRKTGNPFGDVVKRSRIVGFVGADYQSAVKNEGARQGAKGAKDFEAESLPWGEWLPGMEGKVIQHNGRLYLRTQTTPGQRKRQPARILSYRAENGRFISRDDVKPFEPVKRESTKQSAAGLGEQKQVMVRTYAFDSIRSIRAGGKTLRFE